MKSSGQPQRRKPLNPGKGLAPGKPIQRKTPMPRGAGPVASVPAPRKRQAPKDPDAIGAALPQDVRQARVLLSGGLCDWCGRPITGPYSIHHRLPGRMGGRRNKHRLAALALLDGTGTTGCHGLLESSRTLALGAGFLIPDGAAVPAPELYPMFLHQVRWVLVTPEGFADSAPLAA